MLFKTLLMVLFFVFMGMMIWSTWGVLWFKHFDKRKKTHQKLLFQVLKHVDVWFSFHPFSPNEIRTLLALSSVCTCTSASIHVCCWCAELALLLELSALWLKDNPVNSLTIPTLTENPYFSFQHFTICCWCNTFPPGICSCQYCRNAVQLLM